ncbi:MAG: hypothetical protein IKN11_04795 [Bacteroidales bacterium]|jgi:outer membrane biosynthesis protein TonB|nr:hypothetical protein [Bacteroidales bacterium]MBR3724693.1 hypothetical protein [Bacteroidales bacterium]MBR5353949.1 hypothetical protein [Bacteroidales bacterium]
MKKAVKLLSLAVVVAGLTVACNNNTPAEEVIDTMPVIDTTPVEVVVDTTPVIDTPVVAPEPAKKATPKKKAVKKEEPKTAVQVDASKMNVKTAGTSITINKQGGATVNTKNGEAKVDASKMNAKTNSGSATIGGGGITIKTN